jgi:hypothetical protein
MPMAVPLLVAGLEVAGGIEAIGGLAAIAAGTAEMTVAGGLMLAGGAMSAIGTLTHDTTLTKLGAIAGLAGGVTQLVSGASGAAGSMGAGADAADAATAPLAQTGTSTIPIEDAASAAPQAAQTPTVPQGGPGDAADLASTGSAAPPGAANAPMSNTPVQDLVPGANTTGNTTGTPPPLTGSDAHFNDMPALSNSGASPPPSSGGLIMDKLNAAGKWVKDNKELAQVGGYMASGAMKSASDQDLLKTKLQLEEEIINRQKARHGSAVAGTRGAMPNYVPAPGGAGAVRPLPQPTPGG